MKVKYHVETQAICFLRLQLQKLDFVNSLSPKISFFPPPPPFLDDILRSLNESTVNLN